MVACLRDFPPVCPRSANRNSAHQDPDLTPKPAEDQPFTETNLSVGVGKTLTIAADASGSIQSNAFHGEPMCPARVQELSMCQWGRVTRGTSRHSSHCRSTTIPLFTTSTTRRPRSRTLWLRWASTREHAVVSDHSDHPEWPTRRSEFSYFAVWKIEIEWVFTNHDV